jgi:hypothetical protein
MTITINELATSSADMRFFAQNMREYIDSSIICDHISSIDAQNAEYKELRTEGEI